MATLEDKISCDPVTAAQALCLSRRAQVLDNAGYFMPHRRRRRKHHGQQVIPDIVGIGAAEGGVCHPDEHVIRLPDGRLVYLHQLHPARMAGGPIIGPGPVHSLHGGVTGSAPPAA